MSRSSRRLKKLSCEEGQSSGNSEGLPGSLARHATLKEEDRSEIIPAVDYMTLLAKLSVHQASIHEDSSRPGTPSEFQEYTSSNEEEEEFSFPKRSAKTSARTSPTPVDLRNSFSALTDNEEEQENTHALLQPTYKDKMPPIFLKLTPSQEHLDAIKSLIHPDTRIQIQGPYLKILTKDQTEYARILGRTRDERWEYFTYNPMVNDRTKFALKGLPTSTDCESIQTAFVELGIHVHHIRQMTKTYMDNGTARQNPIPV